MGPTASGKTALALELARRLPLQLINVDSAQVYRGMDIGTGKPDPDTLREFPHKLMDIRDPAEPYSASDFRADACREISAALEAGHLPLLVGGTMLYFKVLRDGLATMPEADATIRAEIESLAASEGWSAVHDWLARVDPESAARIHPNDPQRLQRALEVYLVSGRTMTDFHRQDGASGENNDNNLPFNLMFFAIQPPDRAVLHDNIARRFRQMLDDGLVEEVQALHQREDLHEGLPSIKSVGYRQVWQYLDGQLDYDAMQERSIIATRQLAKRQLTWLRSWEDLTGLSSSQAQSIETILKSVDSAAI
jgi:tRNA dimethylallyltransferase